MGRTWKCLHQVLGPPPTEIRHDYEAADERSEEGTCKDHDTEQADCYSTRSIGEHVGKHCCNNLHTHQYLSLQTHQDVCMSTHSNRTSPKEARKEPTNQDSLQILRRRTRNVEDGEAKRRHNKRQSPPLEFGKRGPQNWSCCKAEDIQRRS
jgi:hypothetical protein